MTAHGSDSKDRATTTPEQASSLGATLLRVAWLAIILGLVMEVLLLTLGGALGDVLGLRPVVAELVRSVSWSVFVCVGLAVGTAVAKARVLLMGFLGLFSAPVAFEISRVLHKGTLEALAVSGGGGEAGVLTSYIRRIPCRSCGRACRREPTP